MKAQAHKPLLWIAIFVLAVGFACSLGGSTGGTDPAPTATNPPPPAVPTNTSAPPAVETPVDVPVSPSGAVDNLGDVKSATIQIEAQGTFVDPQVGLLVNAAGRGSGFIIDDSGIAVTNNHVVTGAALIKVWVGGETEPRNARLLGVSECSDLAVIDIDGDGFKYLEWFDGGIGVGQDMYIAGFPLGDPEYTLNRGIVSKENANGETNWASVEAVLEYDAVSNPGNSGGPVVDPNGNVLAVHYAGNANTRQAFGIARDAAQPVIDQLRQGQDVLSIGINGTAVASEDGTLTGIWVSSVKSGSEADVAGIEPGDIIYSMEGLVLATDGTMKDYCDILATHNRGETLSFEVIRFSTFEILEGQLNGAPLEVTGFFGEEPGGGDPGGGDEGPLAFFVEEFDGGLGSWSYFLTNGNDSNMAIFNDNGRLVFDIGDENTWVYLTYDEFFYTDVRLDTVAENLGRNNNNVSLICRYSDRGWYEFNIANNGLYSILVFDSGANEYRLLADGGSTAIRSGRDFNEYTAICEGNVLSLWINGTFINSYTDNTYNLREGLIGVSLSSFNVLPIQVEFEWFSISLP